LRRGNYIPAKKAEANIKVKRRDAAVLAEEHIRSFYEKI
jgi:hypothetical protein